MDGIDIRNFRRADHLRNIQIAFAAARRADADSFIGEADVQRIPVCFGIDSDRADSQFFTGTNDAQGDFPRDWLRESS